MPRLYGGKMRKAVWICLAVLALSSLLVAQDEPKRGPSTPEERQRFVAIAHRLEETPLDADLRPELQWALRWLVEVPDITVDVCTAPLGDFMKKKYKYSSEIVVQVTFSSGAFIIEHPDLANDTKAQYVAGVEGALRAYQSILKAKPDVKSKELDDLLQKKSQGTLPSYVRESAEKGCQSKAKRAAL
jgi:carboxypeptidase Q